MAVKRSLWKGGIREGRGGTREGKRRGGRGGEGYVLFAIMHDLMPLSSPPLLPWDCVGGVGRFVRPCLPAPSPPPAPYPSYPCIILLSLPFLSSFPPHALSFARR